jgi:hypothetical protein
MPRQKVVDGNVRVVHRRDGKIELRVILSGPEIMALIKAPPKSRHIPIDVKQFSLYDFINEQNPKLVA